MGTIINQSIVVCAFDNQTIESAYEKALQLFEDFNVSNLSKVGTNGIRSFCVFPCGSKYGWQQAEQHERNLKELTKFLQAMAYDDGSSPVEFVFMEFCGEMGYLSSKGSKIICDQSSLMNEDQAKKHELFHF